MQISLKNVGMHDPGKAATNMHDFLQYIASPIAGREFAQHGVDLEKTIKEGMAKGVSPLEAVIAKTIAMSGGGSVRLQSNGQAVLRTDDASSGVDDGLLRSGSGSLNWIAEGRDANVDWYWIAKSTTGCLRLQANGLTTLRTGCEPDRRERLGDVNVNIVLAPKGSGTVVTPTMACTDNATNVASTAA
jgi:hypothetical protein